MPEEGGFLSGLHTSHLSAGNDGTSKGGTQEISLLVDGIALDSAEAKLIDELLAEVLNDPVIYASVIVPEVHLEMKGLWTDDS